MKTYIITVLIRKIPQKKVSKQRAAPRVFKNLKNKLILAGPILNKNNKPKGSVLILKFQNRLQLSNF